MLDIPATITKNGCSESIPLVPVLANALRKHRREARATDAIIDRVPSMPEIRTDLKAADIEE